MTEIQGVIAVASIYKFEMLKQSLTAEFMTLPSNRLSSFSVAFRLRLASSWLPVDMSLGTSGLDLDEPTLFAGRTIMLGLCNDEEGIVVVEAQNDKNSRSY